MKNKLNFVLSSLKELPGAQILNGFTKTLFPYITPCKCLPLFLLLFFVIVQSSTAQIISTIAGNGTYGLSGDGGAATSAEMTSGYGIAVDGSGNVYFADVNNHRIRKVSASGSISTIAGSTFGYSGDGGPATDAQLNFPYGVAVDGSGNVYIADTWNHRIRKVSASGIITTIAGNGAEGYNGDGIPATDAELNYPQNVAVDRSGNVYIADGSNYIIRKINTGGIISTIAGNGVYNFYGDGGQATDAELSIPTDVAVDGSGNIYIVDGNNYRIRKINTSGIISTFAGTGSGVYNGEGIAATDAGFSVWGISVDGSGNVYIADWGSHRIRMVNASSGFINTVAGNGTGGYSGDGGPAALAELNRPSDVAVDGSGNVYFTDKENKRIRKVSAAPPSGIPTLSEWGLILFTLLLLSFGMVFVHKRQNALIIAGYATQGIKPSLFELGLFFKALGGIMLLAIAGLLASYRYFGTLTLTDTLGTIASGFIVAYMVQLLMNMRRK